MVLKDTKAKENLHRFLYNNNKKKKKKNLKENKST
jgi:hypothetical protein